MDNLGEAPRQSKNIGGNKIVVSQDYYLFGPETA